jgi:phosphatidylglycerophosphate synthase
MNRPQPHPAPTVERVRLSLREVLNPAGMLTLSRFPIAVLYPFFAANDTIALGLLLLAAATDMLDGVVARATGTSSHTGAVLDGWIDKVLYVNVAWTLVLLHDVPGWWMLAWFSREILQGLSVPLLVPAYYRGLSRTRSATPLGKVTTWAVGLSMTASLLDLWTLAFLLMPVAGVSGFVSAARYLYRELSDLRQQARAERSNALVHTPVDPALDGASAAR